MPILPHPLVADIANAAPQTLVILGAVIGGSAAALINLIGGFITRHLESKRQFRELAIKAALENWRHTNEIKKSVLATGYSGTVSFDEPDPYICHMLRIMEIAADTSISSVSAATKIQEMNKDASN